jgi:hypothetical protein
MKLNEKVGSLTSTTINQLRKRLSIDIIFAFYSNHRLFVKYVAGKTSITCKTGIDILAVLSFIAVGQSNLNKQLPNVNQTQFNCRYSFFN